MESFWEFWILFWSEICPNIKRVFSLKCHWFELLFGFLLTTLTLIETLREVFITFLCFYLGQIRFVIYFLWVEERGNYFFIVFMTYMATFLFACGPKIKEPTARAPLRAKRKYGGKLTSEIKDCWLLLKDANLSKLVLLTNSIDPWGPFFNIITRPDLCFEGSELQVLWAGLIVFSIRLLIRFPDCRFSKGM